MKWKIFKREKNMKETLPVFNLQQDYILRLLMSEFMQKRDQESLIAVLLCLRDSYVWIPCTAKMGKLDEEKILSGKVTAGSTLSLEEDMRLEPDIFQDSWAGEDVFYFPVFSNVEQMGEEYGSHFSKIEKPFFEAMNMAMANKKVKGIIVDAFTIQMEIPKELFEVIAELPDKTKRKV